METATRAWTRYSTEQQAAALAVLAENGDNAAAASRETGIPETTIKEWRAARTSLPPANLVAEMKAQRADQWDKLQDAGIARALEKLPEANARDAAIIAGIAVDKAALLRGESGPAADPETLARLELFRARYAQAQQLHVHIHPPAQTDGPVPIVLQPHETQGKPGDSEGAG